MNKPITIAREELKNNMADLINNSGLPFFVVSDILKDFMAQIAVLERQQLEADRNQYAKEQEEKKDEDN